MSNELIIVNTFEAEETDGGSTFCILRAPRLSFILMHHFRI